MAELADVVEMFSNFRLIGLRNGPDLSTTEKQLATAKAWLPILASVSPAELQHACVAWGEESQFWPAPAEIRKLCPSIQKRTAQIEAAKNDDGMGVWPRVLKYVGSLGTNCKPEEWKGRLVRDLPCSPDQAPAIIAGIEAAGWRQIAQSDNDWIRKDLGRAFSRAYQQQVVTGGKVIGLNNYKRLAGGRDVE